jgi:hypothetical protein
MTQDNLRKSEYKFNKAKKLIGTVSMVLMYKSEGANVKKFLNSKVTIRTKSKEINRLITNNFENPFKYLMLLDSDFFVCSLIMSSSRKMSKKPSASS